MNRAVQRPGRCWEVEGDADWPDPHCTTEAAARHLADEAGQPRPAVARLPFQCWEALCARCGAALEHVEFGHTVHYRDRLDAESDVDVRCDRGCEPPGPDPLAPSTDGMEPLPGIEVAS